MNSKSDAVPYGYIGSKYIRNAFQKHPKAFDDIQIHILRVLSVPSQRKVHYTRIFIQFIIFFRPINFDPAGFHTFSITLSFRIYYTLHKYVYNYIVTKTPNITNLFPDLTTSSLCYMIIIFCCYFLILNFFFFFLHFLLSWVIVTSSLLNWCDFYWFLH